jgi:hypothetical protein
MCEGWADALRGPLDEEQLILEQHLISRAASDPPFEVVPASGH